jgi:hypothetical protein
LKYNKIFQHQLVVITYYKFSPSLHLLAPIRLLKEEKKCFDFWILAL